MEIKGTLPDGSPFALSDLKGNIVLIDFWASWCGPCRKSSPELVSIYNTYHGQFFKDAKGFEIVSIGLENSKAGWAQAIQNDGLRWPYHLMESSAFDAPATLAYTVKQVPTKFLINPEGIIMAVDPSFKEIARILEDRIKAKG
jgi:thiol-disulfide isomerase/thioredoxin